MDSSLDMIILSCAGYDRTDLKLSPAHGLLTGTHSQGRGIFGEYLSASQLTSESTTKSLFPKADTEPVQLF
jgi:hypothetical protein